MNSKILGAALALLCAGTSAQAGITIYTNQASYLAAIGNPATDSFDDLLFTTVNPPLNRTAGAYGYAITVSGGGSQQFFAAGTNADRWLSTNSAGDTIEFGSFAGGVYGAGGFVFGSDLGGNFQAGDVIFTATSGSLTASQTVINATTSSFIGFVSDMPLTALTLRAVQPQSGTLWPTMNNLTLGGQVAAVPEPTTWAMMIAGFGLIGAGMRRRAVRTVVSFG